jgi:diguanylate cyclase (GGDEF)-like protein
VEVSDSPPDARIAPAHAPESEWGRSTHPLPHTIGATLDSAISAQPTWAVWVEALLLIGAVGALDHFSGTELAFSVFYLVPVIFATWFASRRAGAAMAVLSAATWASLDVLGGAHYSSSFIPVWNGMVRLAFFMIILSLIHVMKDSRARESELARTDSLTGIANGRSFSDRARLELASMRRTGRHLTMAYIDLDRFKAVNDTLGHTEGDRLLRHVAQAIRSRLRETDLVARLGGDEFGVLLPDTEPDTVPAAIEAMHAAVSEVVEGAWNVSCTIGAVTFEVAPESVDFMVRAADELMYRGKCAGRDRIELAVWPSAPEDEPGDED